MAVVIKWSFLWSKFGHKRSMITRVPGFSAKTCFCIKAIHLRDLEKSFNFLNCSKAPKRRRAVFFRTFAPTFVKKLVSFWLKKLSAFDQKTLQKLSKNVEGMEVFSFSWLRSSEKLKTSIPSTFFDSFCKVFWSKADNFLSKKMDRLYKKCLKIVYT